MYVSSHEVGEASIEVDGFPPDSMDIDVDIFTFRDQVLIVTPDNKSAVVIREYKTARAFKQLLIFSLNAGRKIDLNAFTNSVIKSRECK